VEHSLGAIAPAAALDDVLLLLLPLPVILAANFRVAPVPEDPGRARLYRVLGAAAWVGIGAIVAVALLFGFYLLAVAPLAPGGSAGPQQVLPYGTVISLSAVASALVLFRPARDRLARALPIDPTSPVHACALVLSILLVGTQLANQLSTDVLAEQARTGAALGPLDLVAQELPFLVLAVAGVGLVIRRSPASAARRLGLVRPTPWQLALALAAAGAFFAFGNGADYLSHVLTPGLAGKVDAANGRLFSRLTDPVGIATIAITAGICEEVLFRGALQPRLGILWPAVVFAAIHTQYGLSVVSLAVLVLAVGLGLLRRFTNTTTTIVCHVTYDTLVGVGIGGPWLVPALAVEAVLLLGCCVRLYRRGRQPAHRPIESGAEP
jgi:uncharacterized protein